MALAISNVPVLTGDVADRFVKEAEYNAKNLAGQRIFPVGGGNIKNIA